MSGFNQVILLGRLGNDPELKFTQGGTAVVGLSMATSRRQKDRDGEWQEVTSWHRIKAFGKQAEVIGEHCHKGDLLFVEGRLDYWEAEGKRGKLMVAEVILEHFEFAGGGGRSEGGRGERSGSSSRAPARGATRGPTSRGGSQAPARAPDDFVDDDIPF